MKKINKILLTLFSLTSASMLYATENKAIVDVQIDSDFKSKNIIFVADDESGESLGVHHAGQGLMLHSEVDPISKFGDYYPVEVKVLLTNPKTNMTQIFYSKNQYIFKPGTHIALSFPEMFSN